MVEGKKEARRMWKSGRATHKSKQIVARGGLRGRIAAMEATEEGRRELGGWVIGACIVALLAFILVDMALGGAA